jgi:deoxyribodipyrimidine photo-lyase
MKNQILLKRGRQLNVGEPKQGNVLYWMSRDQRAADNWALLAARDQADILGGQLIVVFCFAPSFLDATWRHYAFMLAGLHETERDLRAKGIAFHLLWGDPAVEIAKFVAENNIAGVVTDFDPLRLKRSWDESLAVSLTVPFWQVDAHNIVPCWLASPKQEFAAYTFRPKISKLLATYQEDFPSLRPQDQSSLPPAVDWPAVESSFVEKHLTVDKLLSPAPLSPGSLAAQKRLAGFLNRLDIYAAERNNPVADAQSGLSAYLHYGQLSAQRVALAVEQAVGWSGAAESFLEELVVRRELADNYCHYCDHYDTPAGFPAWAGKSLAEHASDPRPTSYSLRELEGALTSDDLWNAAQRQMSTTGRMHGYMRMYWAKKILEWSPDACEAQKRAIFLNDKYSLDGSDPSGYAGIAWSIGGVHDRAWPERPIFGKVRYMNRRGCDRKFKTAQYIDRYK